MTKTSQKTDGKKSMSANKYNDFFKIFNIQNLKSKKNMALRLIEIQEQIKIDN